MSERPSLVEIAKCDLPVRHYIVEVEQELAALRSQVERLTHERDEALGRIDAMEPFQSGWEDPDLTIVELERKLATALGALEEAWGTNDPMIRKVRVNAAIASIKGDQPDGEAGASRVTDRVKNT